MSHDKPHRRSEARIQRIAAYAAAVFSGGLVGLAVVLLVLRWFGPGPLPELTVAQRDEALARWRRVAPADYDLVVVVQGRERDIFRVQVRDGTVQAALRNGRLLKQQRIWITWTVGGMFETVAKDLASVQRQRDGPAAGNPTQLLLRGEFDTQWGFPRRYQRTELRKFGENYEVTWEVTEFRPG